MAHTAVEIREQRGGFIGNHGGFTVGSHEGIDGREGFPKRGDQNLYAVGFPARADGRAEESFELAESWLDGLFKVVQIGV
jgi:hypothetical protein